MAPISGGGGDFELDVFGDMVSQGVINLRNEEAGEAFRVSEDGFLLAIADLAEDLVEGGAGEAGFAGGAVDQVEDR